MLVLRRKAGESLVIGDGIRLTMIGIEGEQVKIGIEAPRHIAIHREEVFNMIQNENRKAHEQAASLDISKVKQLAQTFVKKDKENQ